MSDTDRDWEWFGAHDPYFGVVSHAQFRRATLDPEALEAFFAGGEHHVDSVFRLLEQHVQRGFRPARALDFGCGVGRLVVPLAARCERVVGVDVSPSMLAIAADNCRDRAIENATFVQGDDTLSRCEGRFDFVHSFIVFQHIPVRRGLQLLDVLLGLLEPGGVGALHFTHDCPEQRSAKHVIRNLPLIRQLNHLRLGYAFSKPTMQMNEYDLNAVFSRLHEAGVSDLHVEFTRHGSPKGALLLFRTPRPEEAEPSPPAEPR